jgi:hypothetical protein
MDRAQMLAMLLQLSFDTDQLLLTHGDDSGVLADVSVDGPAVFSATLGHFLSGYMLARQELVESEEELTFLMAVGKTGGDKFDD